MPGFDIRAAEEKQMMDDTRQAILEQVQLRHPIVYDNLDICAMYREKRLKQLSIAMLNTVCIYFDISTEGFNSKRKAEYIAVLKAANKHRGFRSLFYDAHFVFHLPTAITYFSETTVGSPVQIKGFEKVDQEALFSYDTAVFGFERHAFLSKWLRVTGSHARVAINSEGSIVGYTVARPTLVKEESYKIGPIFADSELVAEKLLKAVFEELLRQEEPTSVVSIDAPTKRATELCERLKGKRLFDMVYMIMDDVPDARFDKWFGYTTTQLG
ncbi:hypothetical protein ACROYT_G022231 [Oculina patagonica]